MATVSAGLDRMADLDCVHAYRHGPDAGISDGDWDYAVVAVFESEAAYHDYSVDPDHVALIGQHIKPNIAARAAVQIEL